MKPAPADWYVGPNPDRDTREASPWAALSRSGEPPLVYATKEDATAGAEFLNRCHPKPRPAPLAGRVRKET